MSDSRIDWWPPIDGAPASSDFSGGGEPAPQHEPPRRSRARERERAALERSASRRGRIVAIVVSGLLVLGALYVGWSLWGPQKVGSTGSGAVEDYPGPGAYPPATVQINPGDTGAMMAKTLHDADVVASAKAFTDAFAANPDASKIQPGTYSLLKKEKAADAVTALLSPANRVSMKVTIPEGYSVKQIVQRINEVTLIPVDDLNNALKDPAAIDLPAEAGGNAEGWLFPSTYTIEPGATATSVLKQMSDQMVKVLTAKGVQEKDWKTVLTKASLVEREAKRDVDRPPMAQAIDNRLAHDMPLQIDATTSYGLGQTGAPTSAQNNDASNPYSTYAHMGLPPTPIASPGEASIDAVLNPADGTWIFWQLVDPSTGETKFEDTLAQHNQDIAQLDQWIKDHPTATAGASSTP